MKKFNKLLLISLLMFGMNGVKAEGSYNTVSCGLVDGIPAALPSFTTNMINIVKVLVPIILIILGMIDFTKAMTSNDEKQIKISQNSFVKRIIGAVAVFLVIAVVQLIFSILGTDSSNEMLSCIKCFTSNSCSRVGVYENCRKQANSTCQNRCSESLKTSNDHGAKCMNDCINTEISVCDEKFDVSNNSES